MTHIVFATDMEPDDVLTLRFLLENAMRDAYSERIRLLDEECQLKNKSASPTPDSDPEPIYVTLLLGEGNFDVKSFIAGEVMCALTKEYPDVQFYLDTVHYYASPVEYPYEDLDAEFNADVYFEPARFNDDMTTDAIVASNLVELMNYMEKSTTANQYPKPTVYVWTRPMREFLEQDSLSKFDGTDAPMYIYGGYNLRGCREDATTGSNRLVRMNQLPGKFRGGVHVMERNEVLGHDFDPMSTIADALEKKRNAFWCVYKRLCRVWNKKTLMFKMAGIEHNFTYKHAFDAFKCLVEFKNWDGARAIIATSMFIDEKRGVCDGITIINCARYPDTQLLFADVLVPLLMDGTICMFEKHVLVDFGHGSQNPKFKKATAAQCADDNVSKFLLPVRHDALSIEDLRSYVTGAFIARCERRDSASLF